MASTHKHFALSLIFALVLIACPDDDSTPTGGTIDASAAGDANDTSGAADTGESGATDAVVAADASEADLGGGSDTAMSDAAEGQDVGEGQDADAALDAADADSPMNVVFGVVDTGLDACYGQTNDVIACPSAGEPFYGQDAQYSANSPTYELNGAEDIVIDLNTALMWERAHHATKLSYSDAVSACEGLTLGTYSDWRLPTIKELFSLSDFRGEVGGEFYLEASFFDLEIPTDEELTGTHSLDMMGQTWSSTIRPDEPSRGYYFYNFLDGHIKSAPDNSMFELFYRCVRGTEGALENDFEANGDGTVSDQATGLMWQQTNATQSGSDRQFTWEEALSYCEALSLGGHDDWLLPDVKQLQSIVDYTRTEPSIDTTVFEHEQTVDTGAYFWSSTSMINYPDWATYVCFGPCLSHTGMDIHGPGAQRADPKWDNGHDFSAGVGDQQDVVQIHNYVRCVRF